VHAAAILFDLHLPACGSLKEKRQVVRPIVEGLRNRYGVAASEVGGHDLWQRARIAVAAVAESAARLDEVLAQVERFVWSHPEIEVMGTDRTALELDGDLVPLPRSRR
jgi:uncharacterized protein YlxP (DUF503 family)